MIALSILVFAFFQSLTLTLDQSRPFNTMASPSTPQPDIVDDGAPKAKRPTLLDSAALPALLGPAGGPERQSMFASARSDDEYTFCEPVLVTEATTCNFDDEYTIVVCMELVKGNYTGVSLRLISEDATPSLRDYIAEDPDHRIEMEETLCVDSLDRVWPILCSAISNAKYDHEDDTDCDNCSFYNPSVVKGMVDDELFARLAKDALRKCTIVFRADED